MFMCLSVGDSFARSLSVHHRAGIAATLKKSAPKATSDRRLMLNLDCRVKTIPLEFFKELSRANAMPRSKTTPEVKKPRPLF